jgi:hypothetical protein
MNKIIEGLKEALAYARGDCRHTFTPWVTGVVKANSYDEEQNRPRISLMTKRKRTCQKCGIRETEYLP